MTTKLKDIFKKEEELSEPENIAVDREPVARIPFGDEIEIKVFKFTFRPFPDYYFIDKSGDLYYLEQPKKEELDELDRGEMDSLTLKMREVSNPNKSPQLFYDDLGEPHSLQPGARKEIKVSRKKTRIFASADGHYFTGARDKQYVLVSEFSEENIEDETEIFG